MRAPTDTIAAPPFLAHLRWVNVASLRLDKQLGNPVLVEFWDACRPNSLRTLPYVKAWHERYGAPSRADTAAAATASLRVVGIHSPGFPLVREREQVRDVVARLGVEYPVLVDPELEMWREYDNRGWPARYLFDERGMLFHYHYGEGAYRETELAIQELLGVEREPLAPLRPEDVEGAALAPQSEDVAGVYCGSYEAGGVWAVLDGHGAVRVNGGRAHGGAELAIAQPGAYPLIEHARHTAGELDLSLDAGVRCLATCFTPGLA